MESKQLRSEFELGSLIPFPTTIDVVLSVPPSLVRCDRKWIFLKWGKAGSNSEFFFYTDYLNKDKKKNSVLLFTYNWEENRWIHAFPKDISATWNYLHWGGLWLFGVLVYKNSFLNNKMMFYLHSLILTTVNPAFLNILFPYYNTLCFSLTWLEESS